MNKTNSIKQSQLLLVFMMIIPGGKFLSLPALVASQMGHDSYLAFIILFAADLLCLCMLIWAFMLNKQGKTLVEVLEQSVGKVVTKVLFVILTIFFMLRAINLMLSCMQLFATSIMLKTNWVAFIIPIMILVIFNLYKGLYNIGRLAEILFLFVFLAFVLIFAFSVGDADFTNILPYQSGSVANVIGMSFNYSFWFSDYLFIMMLMGRVAKLDKFGAKAVGSFVVGAVITVAMDILFIGLFGDTAWLHNTALSKISQFNVAVSTSGRFDWINIIVWSFSLFIKLIVYFYCANESVKMMLPVKKKEKINIPILVGICAVVIALPLLVPIDEFIFKFIAGGAGKYVLMVVQYALPLMLPLLVWVGNKRSKADVKKDIQAVAV